MEKLVLALVYAARRLRRYFQGHTIKVITDKPIIQILNNREATRRLAKWGIELEAYGIKYAPRSVIKGQIQSWWQARWKDHTKQRVRKPRSTRKKALEMSRSFNNFQISHIPREDNQKADALSKFEAVQCEGLTKGVLIEELNERSVDTVEVNAIIEEATRTWMTPIQEYIKHGILLEDVAEARMIQEKACNYTMEEGIL
ncbi:reverse transcriptase domain-containing protein [Tanacetum coccineum]